MLNLVFWVFCLVNFGGLVVMNLGLASLGELSCETLRILSCDSGSVIEGM